MEVVIEVRDSIVAAVAKATQELQAPWSFTVVTWPRSCQSCSEVERSKARLVREDQRRAGGGVVVV